MSPAVSSSHMVGRGDELAVLQDTLREGAAGEARAVLIRGEAGSGKTRLLEEFLDSLPGTAAPDLPVAISRSQCLDMGPIGAPLSPIRRMWRDLYATVGNDALRIAAASTQVLAALGAVVPELDEGSSPHLDGRDNRLAEAIERVIEGLSAHVHLVLVIEHLHWADDATLALLRTLATTLRGKHLTLVMNYRMEDVGRGHPLRAVLSELERSRSMVSITLRRLDRDEIAAQSTQILGREPTADELDTLELLTRQVSLTGTLESVVVPLWAPLVYILALGSFAPFVLLLMALRHTSATAVGIAASSEVLFAFAVAWVWLGESLSLLQVAGSIVVFVGMVLAQTAREPSTAPLEPPTT